MIIYLNNILRCSMRAPRISSSVSAPETILCFRIWTCCIRSSTVPWNERRQQAQRLRFQYPSCDKQRGDRDAITSSYLDDEASDSDLSFLPNAVNSHDSLLFHSRIPPWILYNIGQDIVPKPQHDDKITKMHWTDRMQYKYHHKNIGGSS